LIFKEQDMKELEQQIKQKINGDMKLFSKEAISMRTTCRKGFPG